VKNPLLIYRGKSHMEKLLTEISGSNISEDRFLNNKNTSSPVINFELKKSQKPKTLTACVQYLSKINDIEQDLSGVCFGFDNIVLNDELSDKKVRYIATELASAIDNNSIEKIRQLKRTYGNDKEFLTAKNFLDKKCKEIWNAFDTKDSLLNIPKEAMKILGITNIPSLEFLLGNSLRYYEKDDSSSTAQIISSVLNNKNLPYTIIDIHKYMEELARREKCKYNLKTVTYLITRHNYDYNKLCELKIEKYIINKAFKSLSVINKIKYLIRSQNTRFRKKN